MSRLTATDRLARLLAIIPWVAADDRVPIDEVSRRFDYPRGDLVQDLAEVVFMVGVHPFTPDTLIEVEIDDEDNVSIRYATWFSKPLSLSREQQLAMLLAGRALLDLGAGLGEGEPHPSVGDPNGSDRVPDDDVPGDDVPDDEEQAGPLLRAITKLELAGGLSEGTLELQLGAPAADVLATLRAAVERRRAVEIDHYSFSRDEQRVRTVEPWRVFTSEGHWYLAGWCRRADAERIFRVDRIASARILDEVIEPKPFATDDEDAVLGSVSDPSRPRLVVDVDRDDAWIGAWYPTDEVRERPDGRLRISMPVTGPAFVERLLVRLGPTAQVVSAPDGWGSELRSAAAGRILRRYARLSPEPSE